jgi:TRAP transporter TAXI family solute receptor
LHQPIEARELATAGSIENVALLTASEPKADLAFVQSLALAATPGISDRIQVLAYLYPDVVQIVVGKNAGIESLSDLSGKRIFIGREKSGTRLIAEKLLESILGEDGEYTPYPPKGADAANGSDEGASQGPVDGKTDSNIGSFDDASDRLIEGSIDAAIIVAGTPTDAVNKALKKGCRLLSLGEQRGQTLDGLSGGEAVDIPASFYEEQANEVKTVGIPVFLVGRKELDADLVARVLDALFDNIAELLLAHSGVGEIRLQDAFPLALPAKLRWHQGALRFQEQEAEKLLIATGVPDDKYHRIGKVIEEQLELEGIPARAIHTDGSLENALLLRVRPHNTLAILQYDIALAVAKPGRVYKERRLNVGGQPIHVKGICRIATLHDEKVHIVVRRESILDGDDKSPTVKVLDGLRVCSGPEESGTAVAAQAILDRYEVEPRTLLFLPVREMVNQLRGGSIDAGFFVSGTPSEAMNAILQDGRFRLLSIDPHGLRDVIRSTSAIAVTEFPPGTYGCQGEGEPPIVTLSTKAVLVATNELDDVKAITNAIIRAASFLGLEGGPDQMAKYLPSLGLHPDADEAYREEGYLPSEQEPNPYELIAAVLSILVIVLGSAKASRALVRERIVNRIKGQILDVKIDHGHRGAILELFAIRTELRQRARRKWWHPGQLDKSRWNDVRETMDSCMQEARSTLMRSLLSDVHALAAGNEASKAQSVSSLRQQVWLHAAQGELGESQLSLILQALEEACPHTRA